MGSKHGFLLLFSVSGILKSKEGTQDSVSFGVGVYAGSTVFNLTLVWGMCVIIGRKEFLVKSGDAHHHSSFKEKLSELKGFCSFSLT